MGGKNHQPCNKPGTAYLLNATKMSRSMSLASLQLEQANVSLEDVLIDELEGRKSRTFNLVVENLNQSDSSLNGMLSDVRTLRADMMKHGFTDLPTLRTTDLGKLGSQLSEAGMVEISSWNTVAAIMRRTGFHGVLNHFESRIIELRSCTQALSEKFTLLAYEACHGVMNRVLEENRPGNIKVEFAQLYSRWGSFHAEFLASSMLSTELWYAATGVGSLLQRALEPSHVA